MRQKADYVFNNRPIADYLKTADCRPINRVNRSIGSSLHRLLLIKIKRATMCMNQRPIKCRDMHVGGLDSELHDTPVQYNNLNMHNHHYRLKAFNLKK